VARRRDRAFETPPSVPRVALIDANVFFSPRMRDLVMQLRELEVIRIHWTKAIEVEWARNVIEKQAADPKLIEACLVGMREATDGDWEVAGYEKYERDFEAVDRKDRHVAAAAYKLSLDDWPGQKVALVTRNIKDFPQKAFNATEVTRYSLALYLERLCAEEPDLVPAAIELCRKKLRKPSYSKADYVAMLLKNGCQSLAETIAALWNVACPSLAEDGSLTYDASEMAKKKAAANVIAGKKGPRARTR
jgi:PIN domain